MYWIVDGFCFLFGIAIFIYFLVDKKGSDDDDDASLSMWCWVGFVWIAIYPIILETIYNVFATCCSSKKQYTVSPRSHFVYHEDSNITFCGL